jgi:hypothetical protein
MPIRKLTALAVPALPPGDYPDAVMPGLMLRVGKRRRAWTYRARVAGSYPRFPLGHFPAVGLAEARQEARALRERLESGAPITPPPRTALTLGGLIDRYERVRCQEGGRNKTLGAGLDTVRRLLEPWLDMPAVRFGKADLREARNILIEGGKPIMGNRLLGYLSPVLRWGAEEDLIEVNFVPAIRRSPERTRSHTLSPGEIGAIWRACECLDDSPTARSCGGWCGFYWRPHAGAARRPACATATSSTACGSRRRTRAIGPTCCPCRRWRSRWSARERRMHSCFPTAMAAGSLASGP